MAKIKSAPVETNPLDKLAALLNEANAAIIAQLSAAKTGINNLRNYGIDPTQNKELVGYITDLGNLLGVSKPAPVKRTATVRPVGVPTPVQGQIKEALPNAGETGIGLDEILKRQPALKKTTVAQTLGKMVNAGLIARAGRGLYTKA